MIGKSPAIFREKYGKKKLERREELNMGRQKTVSGLITHYLTDRKITGRNRLSTGLKSLFSISVIERAPGGK